MGIDEMNDASLSTFLSLEYCCLYMSHVDFTIYLKKKICICKLKQFATQTELRITTTSKSI